MPSTYEYCYMAHKKLYRAFDSVYCSCGTESSESKGRRYGGCKVTNTRLVQALQTKLSFQEQGR